MEIPPKKGLAAQSHWLRGSALLNINGGHFEGYIRKAGLGSVPKIANTSTFLLFIYSGPSGREPYLSQRLFTSQPNRLVCFTLLIAFQVLKPGWLTVVVYALEHNREDC